MSERFTKKLLQPDTVADLLAANKEKVGSVLAAARTYVASHAELEEAARQAPLDELFVLRFVLSEKTEGNASENIKKTLEWRSNRLEDLKAAREGRNRYQATVSKYSKLALIGCLGGLHPTVVVRAGRSNTKGMFEEIPPEHFVECSLLNNEMIYSICDKKTRETGLLCKQVAIIDLEGFSLLHYDSKFNKALGQSSQLSAIYYPQLLGKTVIINMPVTFRLLYKGISMFMPASTLEKQTLCPANTLKKSATECPFLKKFDNGVSIMPQFLGGTREMLPELVLSSGKS